MPERVKIEAGLIVAYQGGEHRLLWDGCVVLEGTSVIYVGKRFDGRVDRELDMRGRLLTPGFINVHTHLSESPLDKSLIEDVGKRQFSLSKLADLLPARGQAIDEAGRRACVDYSMAELIRTGTTTVMELGPIGDYVADAAEGAGLRAYIADGYRSARWYTADGRNVRYAWDEEAGRQGFRRAVELIERLEGRAGGRIQGFLSPMQVDTCTEELLKMSREASDALGVPLALHASQSVFEFDEMVRRTGMTPIEWLDHIGFLSEWTVLGHAIMIAGHSWVQFAGDDLPLLARAGASVAHAPWVFNRGGLALETFPKYQDAGVNLCLATDTAPQSMLEAMKFAAVVGKVLHRQAERATAADVFNAATLNAAKMLHRDDLGRVAPGAKADLLFWDLTGMFMTPLRDPIKNLVYNAQAEDLQEVMVDGAWVMKEGRVLHVDEARVTRELQRAGERMWAAMGPGDWAGRGVDELSPPTFGPYRDDPA